MATKRLSGKSNANKKNCSKAGKLTQKRSSVGGKVLRKCRTKKGR